ncbi:hypothetical protein PTTG_10238, partial [Puccinia triticina 1-1 BBBD Race 1]
MAQSIVHFSKAQQRGFVAAYMELFGESDPNEALQKLKGCRKHFWQSITRVKQNRAVIMADEQDDGPTHNKKVDEMRRRFPKIKVWLDWWMMANVKAMLFPSRRKMLEDCPNGENGLPSSTNAQESMHRYYDVSSGKKTLKAGFAELYAFVNALEMDHAMIQRGCPIRYGTKARNQEDVSHSIGWIKPTKQNAISFAKAGLLVMRWATSGLSGTLGLQCKGCNALAGNKSCPKKKSGILPPSNYLEEVLNISFADSKSPPHLYFHIDVTTISDEDKRLEFMGQMNWPFKLMVAGEVYTLMSRGYWGGHHYWGKVLRKFCGVIGVWLHNDWAWTDKEATFVDESIQRIQQDNPKITATFPFTHMKTFLNISYNGEVTVDSLNPPLSPKKKIIR